jgi:guanosine-3',5'-bis(diphosphate) 3'-pyrophosphohydrolase
MGASQGMNLIEQAKLFATQKHVLDNHQLYGNLLPYTHHLAAVEAVLRRFEFYDEALCAAAWLHDVVEDTRDRNNEVKIRDIEEVFGDDIAVLVGAVTSEPGENRKVRNALTYPKIREAGPRAVALKLADRIANVEAGGRMVIKYRKEHPDFQHGIYIAKPASWGETEIWDEKLRLLHTVYDMQCTLDSLLHDHERNNGKIIAP